MLHDVLVKMFCKLFKVQLLISDCCLSQNVWKVWIWPGEALNFTLNCAESCEDFNADWKINRLGSWSIVLRCYNNAVQQTGCQVSNRSTHSLNVGESVAFWEVVRVPFPEHVTHAAAGKNLQASSAHPHPERKFCRRRDTEDEVRYADRSEPRLSVWAASS